MMEWKMNGFLVREDLVDNTGYGVVSSYRMLLDDEERDN